jgi:putative transposase
VAVVHEAYVNGVSTPKVDRFVEQMGLRGLSEDQVSRMCRALDEQLQIFRSGRLMAPIPIFGWMPRLSAAGSPEVCATRRW